jgi:hypothetical protein
MNFSQGASTGRSFPTPGRNVFDFFVSSCLQEYQCDGKRRCEAVTLLVSIGCLEILCVDTTVRSRVQTRPRSMGFKGDKIRSTPSFGGEVKPSVPCRRFTAC